MKLTLTFAALFAAVSLMACNNTNTKNKAIKATTEAIGINTPNEEKENQMEVKQMTVEMFKEKVMNYDKNKTDWVFEGDKPALIDFYATWCGPCKATTPIVEELAKQYGGKIDVYKVDIDEQRELATVFGIRSIPSFLFIPKEGKPTMHTGAMNKEQFEKMIKEVMLPKK